MRLKFIFTNRSGLGLERAGAWLWVANHVCLIFNAVYVYRVYQKSIPLQIQIIHNIQGVSKKLQTL